MKKLLVIMGMLCIALSYAQETDGKVSRESLLQRFPSDVAEKLLNEGKLTNALYAKRAMPLMFTPKNPLIEQALSLWTQGRPAFIFEQVQVYPKKTDHHKSIPQLLRSVSKLEGLEYYSPSRKKMRLLYEKSYAVDNAQSRTKINDPQISSASEPWQKVLVLQKDLTFGEFLYQFTFFQNTTTFGLCSENIDPLSYSIFTLVSPHNINSLFIVEDRGDYLLLYSVLRANFPRWPGIDAKLKHSFTARMDALTNWFIQEYE